jgi:histidine ammonia-lyase
MQPNPNAVVRFGRDTLGIDTVLALARGEARAVLDEDPEYRRRLAAGARALDQQLRGSNAIYGVSTGFGDSCDTAVPPDLSEVLLKNLVHFHGCGTGARLSENESAAVVAVRLASLSRGYSGVRAQVLEAMCALLNRRVLPCIPAEGSVGASGDLTPLSYVAAVLMGDREAWFGGQVLPAGDALARAQLEPIALGPKESLAIMNGTSVMTALACFSERAAVRLGRSAAALTAMASDVLSGVAGHFDDRIFAQKPHPGQRAVARWIREDLEYDRSQPRAAARLQDRYSVRCAPHVIGVLLDAQPLFRSILEVEINSVNDNPMVDPETGDILSGGNFYGGHVCFVMDALKNAVANLADLLDRQLVLLCTPATSGGLPANLVGVTGPEKVAHFGFKAMQIATSALTAEALKLTVPASIFSRSTENHNQDKVSMGTIAARDALRVVELVETVTAIHLLALCQAADLRGLSNCHRRTRALHVAVRQRVPMNTADRRMDVDIAEVLALHRAGALPYGEIDFP